LVPADEQSQLEQLVKQKPLGVEKTEIVVDGFRSGEILRELDASIGWILHLKSREGRP